MSNEKRGLGRIFMNGVLTENPTFRLVLGTCPTLAVTTSAIQRPGHGRWRPPSCWWAATWPSPLLRKVIPDKVRIPAFIVVICTFVTIVQLLMQAYPALPVREPWASSFP